MAKKLVETDSEIKLLIRDKKEQSREEFVKFMKERKGLIDKHGKAEAEAQLKVKHKDKITAVKAKKIK